MTWVRIDDQFPDHPKIAAAGPLAGWLHVCGLCYCNRNLTDGFIPDAVAGRLTTFDDGCEPVILLLVEHGIWKKVAGGFAIHDYLDFQLSKAEILELRSKKQAAGRAGGLAAAKAKRQQKAKQNPSKTVAHTPTQDHTPSGSSSVSELPPSSNEPSLPEDDDDHAHTRWATELDMQTVGQYAEEGRK